MARVKHIDEFAALECEECVYKNYSTCNPPKFTRLGIRPLIIAPEGYTYPAFCPVHKEDHAPGTTTG